MSAIFESKLKIPALSYQTFKPVFISILSGKVLTTTVKQISKSKIIFISFATLRRKVSYDIDIFISTRGKSLANLRTEILSHLPPPPSVATTAASNPPSKSPNLFPSRILLLIRHNRMPSHTRHPTPSRRQLCTTPLSLSLLPAHLPANFDACYIPHRYPTPSFKLTLHTRSTHHTHLPSDCYSKSLELGTSSCEEACQG